MEALAELLGESPAIHAVREQLRKLLEGLAAGRRLPALLVQGETGTGKGLGQARRGAVPQATAARRHRAADLGARTPLPWM